MEQLHDGGARDPGSGATALLEAVRDLSGLKLEPTDLEAPLRLLATRTADILDAQLCFAMFHRDLPGAPVSVSAPVQGPLTDWLVGPGGGPWCASIESSEVVWFDGSDGGAEWPEFRGRMARAGVTSGVAIPMIVEGVAIGAVVGMRMDVRRCSECGVAAALAVAAVVGAHLLRQGLLRDAMVRAEQLQGALESRVEIEQAKGLLAGRLGIDVTTAFQLLRDHARRNNQPLASVVSAVVRREIDLSAFRARRRSSS